MEAHVFVKLAWKLVESLLDSTMKNVRDSKLHS